MASDASHMLEAALEQMDDIIFGAQGYPSQGSDSALIPALTSAITPDIRVLQLVEDLRVALEGQVDQESMRRQVPIDTAHTLLEWLEKGGVSTVNTQSPVNGETNQERLTRLEGDKESLVLQVSVLTDQVEAQGVKISDLESSLAEHQHKLNSTEEMLQQVRTSHNGPLPFIQTFEPQPYSQSHRKTPPKHNVSTSMFDGGDGILGVIGSIPPPPNTAS
uniref:Liprin-beta-1/2 coiled-coil domain-containing protein n=1 Tax=Hucho hucho TaxID=62062 RepID=A0A4W5RFG1_9TELE